MDPGADTEKFFASFFPEKTDRRDMREGISHWGRALTLKSSLLLSFKKEERAPGKGEKEKYRPISGRYFFLPFLHLEHELGVAGVGPAGNGHILFRLVHHGPQGFHAGDDDVLVIGGGGEDIGALGTGVG